MAAILIPLTVGQPQCLGPLKAGPLLWPVESGRRNNQQKGQLPASVHSLSRSPEQGQKLCGGAPAHCIPAGPSPGVLLAQVPNLEMNGNEDSLKESSRGPRHGGTETASENSYSTPMV